MDPYIIWILTAIALVIVELLTGTFYLLVLGFAAAAGAALAWLDLPLAAQASAAAIVGVLGVALVRRYRVSTGQTATSINAIDVGQRVTVESWVNEAEGLARVHYRGTLWDAKIIGERGAGTTFYIRGVDGSTLHIAPERV
ncbi:MAG TPA: NfeD family protein [Burkholderiales bacterium]|nr:NfeD family protein [Burkholderiales bacterium]